MTDKTKNIISNLFGVGLLSFVFIEYFGDKDPYIMLFLGVFGLACLGYKMKQNLFFINKLIMKMLGVKPDNQASARFTSGGGETPPPPDDDEPTP